MKGVSLVLFLFVQVALSEWNIDPRDGKLRVPQLLAKYKYPYEEHKVATKDGYYLTLHRILSRKAIKENGKVVYLNHGLLAGSFNWILNGPENSLGYLLADAGYDVWMVNNRGNGYSINRSISTEENYWNFDLDEMGIYDTPASIDYILETTGESDLTFIGHSQGCAIYFIMTSQLPEYETKINKFIALAPVLSLKYVNRMLLVAKEFVAADMLHAIDSIRPFNVAPYLRTLTNLCAYESFHKICTVVYILVQGWTPIETPMEFLTVLFGHFPSGASSKNMLQLIRWFGKDDIGKYNYGPLGNSQNYLQPVPPTYDLSSVHVPKYIFYGGRDNIVLPEAVEYGMQKLRNVKNVTKIGKFSHNDFIHGYNVRKRVNNKILRILKDKY